MKRFYLLLIFAIFLNSLCYSEELCEGIVFDFKMQKLSFDSSSNWKMQFRFYYDILACKKSTLNYTDSLDSIIVDSVCIISSSGRSKLRDLSRFNTSSRPFTFDIVKDSLVKDLVINRFSDSIQILVYPNKAIIKSKFPLVDEKQILVYGNYKNADVGELHEGQSIIFNYKYCKIDDLSKKYQGYIVGKMYDQKANIVDRTNASYFCFHFCFSVDSSGNFIAPVGANIDTLRYFHESSSNETFYIDPISYNLEPDSIIFANIHIINKPNLEVKNHDYQILSVYPNPSSKIINFKFNISQKGLIYLYNSTGTLIKKIDSKGGDLTWIIPKNILSGLYYYKFISESQSVVNGKFVIEK